MNKRRVYLAVLLVSILILLSSAVYAQGLLNSVLTPFKQLDIGAAYENPTTAYILDSIIYFIILIGAAQFALSKQFEGRGGKAVIIGMGIALSISAVMFERKYGFRLGTVFGPLAIIIVVLIFLVAAYRIVQALGVGGKYAGMLAFSFLFFYVSSQLPSVESWFMSNPNDMIVTIWLFLQLFALVFLIWGLVGVIASLAGIGGGGALSKAGDFLGDKGAGGGGGDKEEPLRDHGEVPEPGSVPREEEQFDYRNPGIVDVEVVDLKGNHVSGAQVTLTGASSGKPWHRAFWRKRGPYYSGVTGDDGKVHFPGVPSGNMRLSVTSIGYTFYELSIDNIRTTYIIVKPGDTATEVLVRMKKITKEPLPAIEGLAAEVDGSYKLKGVIR